jgi:hypothetical protein
VVRDFLIVQMPDPRYVGRVPLTLRPRDRLSLGLECFEDAVPSLLDDIILDIAPFRPTFRASLYEDCRHDFSPQLLSIKASMAQSQRLQHRKSEEGSADFGLPARRSRHRLKAGPLAVFRAGGPRGRAGREAAQRPA